jgi:succinate-semialdehyde dehydrogenase/glutarate-semialdehyde dehydrogenase
MDVLNPATGEHVETYEEDTESDVDTALAIATETYDEWRERSIRERERILESTAEILRENKGTYAETMTREMGKPISQAKDEIDKCAWVCDHYAEHASEYLNPDGHPSPPGTVVKTAYQPLGPVLAVMPWNFPFWQVFRFAAPSLVAGNVGLLKHASNVPGCARAIESVFQDTGAPDGVFQSLLLSSDRVDDVIEDDRIRAVTLTGSSAAGSAVASTAGENLKKTVLELGGSDPFVVLDDADVSDASETGAWARNLNGGQSCIAAKRFVVHTDVYEEFLDKFVAEIEALTIGDPTNPETEVGPLARSDFVSDLHEMVTTSVEDGAQVVTGGEPLDRTGAYYPPTVLTDVPEGCPVDAEETFGPIAAIYEVESERDALALANRTEFGLGASIWTENRHRGRQFARQVDAGCVYINQLVKSDPRVPFGGIKDSGYGRELSEAGIKEFVNRKTIWVE